MNITAKRIRTIKAIIMFSNQSLRCWKVLE